jgi:hypothetical protein
VRSTIFSNPAPRTQNSNWQSANADLIAYHHIMMLGRQIFAHMQLYFSDMNSEEMTLVCVCVFFCLSFSTITHELSHLLIREFMGPMPDIVQGQYWSNLDENRGGKKASM